MLDGQTTIALVVALLGLVGVFGASIIAQFSSRNQQAREVLFGPARTFARDALNALATMRGITPPRPPTDGQAPHRNEQLIGDADDRTKRFAECEDAIDQIRVARADVRLVFLPRSLAAEYTRRVLLAERMAMEAAADYFRELAREDPANHQQWRLTRGRELRDQYTAWRASAYFNLDRFFDDVAARVRFPTWNPHRIPPRWDLDTPVTLNARLVDQENVWSDERLDAATYHTGLQRLDVIANRTDRTLGYLNSIQRRGRR
ncbi:hypothetical protein [Microbacterium deminutum]|uniref:Uncharacterized protein n=1 Tax=Microbacterium deminutum TaxID=344164 RepID=A0ABP5BNM0_9MICO